jgi:hypothetical protein
MNHLIQNLKAYPQAIFNLELKAMVAMGNKQRAKSDLDFYLFGIDEAIAKKQELKNETLRKAAKQDLLVDSQIYEELREKLEKCDRDYRLANFELEKAKNEFSVAKLEVRMSILYTEQAA